MLEGDNQYHCEFCATKVDATRQMVLRKLPPYLCLQLQRFVFDYNVRLQLCTPICPDAYLRVTAVVLRVCSQDDGGCAATGVLIMVSLVQAW